MTKIYRHITTFKTKICSLLLVAMFYTTCSGQPLANSTNANTHNQQHKKIVRTYKTQCENLSCQLLDKDGNLWFSILGEGVYCYNGKTFTNFTTKNGLCNNNVGPIIQDRAGNILLGTKQGICKYDGKTFTKYPVPDTLSITCMLEDKEGNLWFGTLKNGIYRYNGTSLDNFLNNALFNLGNTNQLILDILQDNNGNLWFSSWNGGGVWRYDGKTFTNFLPSKEYYLSNEDGRSLTNSVQKISLNFVPKIFSSASQGTISDDMIFSISQDRSGNLWFATRRHGACRYDGKSFTNFSENEGMVSYGIYSILQDKKGNLWFSTDKNGVYCLDGKKLTNYTTANGLVNNSVVSILEDTEGNLWFGTKCFGLSRFDGKSFTSFSQSNN